MLDEVRVTDAAEGDLVEFHQAGPAPAGEYHCARCGYGVAIQAELPQCPMCQGDTWEVGAVSAAAPLG